MTKRTASTVKNFFTSLSVYFDWFYLPKITIIDILEIILLSVAIYYVMLWFKRTRAWTLFKGIIILGVVYGLAYVFKMNTILWIFRNAISVGIIAVIILFQPELRRALEELGRRNFLSDMIVTDKTGDKFVRVSDRTVRELVDAAIEMGKVKTGALIVLENEVSLGEYESTGISVDAVVSRALLENIFEKNTPLHDGAVIIRNNRIVAATCYLPLTARNDLNKELGTRHRAAVGISEVSDSLTIIVSEENGSISVARDGHIERNLDSEGLRRQLEAIRTGRNVNKKSRREKKRTKGGA